MQAVRSSRQLSTEVLHAVAYGSNTHPAATGRQCAISHDKCQSLGVKALLGPHRIPKACENPNPDHAIIFRKSCRIITTLYARILVEWPDKYGLLRYMPMCNHSPLQQSCWISMFASLVSLSNRVMVPIFSFFRQM